MPSSYTPRNRLEKQAAGENNNSWGTRLNDNVIELEDEALDGIVTFSLSGSKTLTTNNAATDEARKRVLFINGGSGGTVTVPNIEKTYLVYNGSSGDVTFTTGSGTSVVVKPGNLQWILCNGSNAIYTADATNFGSQTLNAGSFIASGAGGIGYGTGAGGTVTQTTSKATAVTLNKMSGTITTHNASLAANTAIAFNLNNNLMTGHDNILVTLQDGNNNLYYSVRVGSISPGGGGPSIILKNETSGALSEVVNIRFTVLKGSHI